MKDYSHITNAHPTYIDNLYQQYLADPNNVEEGWRLFFDGFEYGSGRNGETAAIEHDINFIKETAVLSIIHGFRGRGHLLSTTNPIRSRLDRKPYLDLHDFDLDESDLETRFAVGEELGLKNATLREIVERLQKIYSSNIGFEYTYIENREHRNWLRNKIESRSLENDYGLSLSQKKRILEKLNGSVIFERFLHTKYIGQKRFSLEGGETTIAALDAILSQGSAMGVQEFVIGMAHRGRLNVLANIMGKTYENIFSEFEGTQIPDLSFGDGDVKYHLGFSSQIEMNGKTIDLKLAPNPSHLESVNPVVQGFSRAKADILFNSDYDKICPILIHGDAALAGQGVVYETVQMSRLDGYKTGGTIHFVINNQIGFTTDFEDARSSTYSTGVASMVQAPVFHINGDDPEAVVWATLLAVEFRQKFNSDVFIDMVCYRRHGHNEGDEPKFTQPKMYDHIENHPDPRAIYSQRLVERGDVEAALAEGMEKKFWDDLQARLDLIKQKTLPYTYQQPELAWRKLKKKTSAEDFSISPETGIQENSVKRLLDHIGSLPEGFEPLGKVNRLLKGMHKQLANDEVNWGTAELMAYGSILLEGKDVRLSGQDVERGTFSHRHAIFRDKNTYEEYNRLNYLSPNQGKFRIFNSLLSEFAVLGFEYGYTLANPDSLVIWEAQFGDFYNGAQTIIDQYITAAESKWRRMTGLVMLLPHGYEGQGPEHSSARLERFLQQCAEYNMAVVNMTTPANLFHVLRRQLNRPFRKPLIVMSPKSLLRHPMAVSSTTDFGPENRFMEFIHDDISKEKKSKVKRLLLCTGKVYYDLHKYRLDHKIEDIAIMRIEQLYPMDTDVLDVMMANYKKAEVCWVQEEPENMGAWYYIASKLPFVDLKVISRKSSASPATGFKKVHDQNQTNLVVQAMTL